MGAIRTGAGLAVVAGGLLAVLWQTGRHAPQTPRPDPSIAFGNCTALAGGVCLLPDDGRLIVWMAGTGSMGIVADGRPVEPADITPVDGGLRYAIDVPPQTKRVAVTDNGATRFELAVDAYRPDDTLARAWSLLRTGRPDEADSLAATIVDGPGAADALGLRGRVALSRNDTDSARDLLGRAIEAHVQAANRYAGLKDATVLAYLEMHKTRDFDRARAALTQFDPPPPNHAESRYFLDNFLGLTALNAGDARGALLHLQAAARLAHRMGWERRALNAGMVLAVQLQQLGRREEAVELLESWRHRIPDESPPCERADYYTNLGWTGLLVLETGERGVDPTADLATALDLYEAHCPVDNRVNGRINLALAAYHAGALDSAEAHLAAARDETATPELRMLLWAVDIDARIALARGDADEALAGYQSLDALASATLSPSARWRAAVGRASALEALGDVAGALDAYADADRQVDGDIFRVPLDAGRESLMAARDWATRRHVGLALREGRADLAFELVRRARSRVLRSVSTGSATATLGADARRRWESALADYAEIREAMSRDNALSWAMPADELAALERVNRQRSESLRRILDDAVSALEPVTSDRRFRPVREGELILAFHPVPEGWAAFAQHADGLKARVARCPDPDTTATAACLVATLTDSIAGVDRVRVLPVGALRNVDFHALPFGDDVLASAVAVTYGADLAETVRHVPAAGGERRALIVADPRGDLAAARGEAAAVASALDEAGDWTHELLAGTAATDEAVRERLAGATLFHYAGHARYLGPRGWESELALAAETAFSVADILAMQDVPATVVLSGCETARTAHDTPPETIGLANAFLAAGASTVIAATRPVDDATARTLVGGFYSHWQRKDAHEALRLAQLAVRDEQPGSDWSAFRLVTH